MMKNISQKTAIICFLFILAYFPTLQWMWDRWFSYGSYYSHGILVPFISALIIWQKRDALKKIRPQPSSWGMGLFIAGITIHLLSVLFRVYFSSGFSMLIVIAGFVLGVYGKKMFKEVLFPIIFLIFMVPLPLTTVIDMSFPLKMLSAHMATAMLNLINIPAVQQGSYIHMTYATVVVEDVCSGLRSLIALMALGALFAYWMKSRKAKKMVLFLSAIPIALLTNMLRIMALAIVSETWGAKYVPGFVDTTSGFLVFALAFLLLSWIEKLLE